MAQTPEDMEKRSGMEPQLGGEHDLAQYETFNIFGKEILVPKNDLICSRTILEGAWIQTQRLIFSPVGESNILIVSKELEVKINEERKNLSSLDNQQNQEYTEEFVEIFDTDIHKALNIIGKHFNLSGYKTTIKYYRSRSYSELITRGEAGYYLWQEGMDYSFDDTKPFKGMSSIILFLQHRD